MLNGVSILDDNVKIFVDNEKFIMETNMSNGIEISGNNLVIKNDIDIEGNIKNNKIDKLETDVSNIINNNNNNIDILTSNNDASFGNVVIGGNLEVLGTTTTINSSIIELSDNRIQLNSYGNQKAGIDISYSNANISFLYDNTNNKQYWTTSDKPINCDICGSSVKLGNNLPSYYLDYNNFTNTPDFINTSDFDNSFSILNNNINAISNTYLKITDASFQHYALISELSDNYLKITDASFQHYALITKY